MTSAQDILQSHERHILSLDRWFYIELAFLQHVTKAGGEQELERLYKSRCAAGVHESLESAHSAAEALMSESLFVRR